MTSEELTPQDVVTPQDVAALLQELHRRLDVQAAMLQTIVEVQQSIERLLVKVYDPARAKPTPFDVGPSR